MQSRISGFLVAALAVLMLGLICFCWFFYKEFGQYKIAVVEKIDENRKGIDLISSGMSLDEKRLRAVLQTNKIISDYNLKYDLKMKAEFIHSLAMIIVDVSYKYPNFDHLTLCALFAHESRFNIRALSPVGAKGLGQIMDGTAEDICYRFAWGYYDSIAFNPEKNVWMTAFYLNKLIDRNRGNIELALAEYNSGEPRRVQYSFLKAKESGKTLDSLQEIEILTLPEETKKYPVSVMKMDKDLREKYSLLFKEEK